MRKSWLTTVATFDEATQTWRSRRPRDPRDPDDWHGTEQNNPPCQHRHGSSRAAMTCSRNRPPLTAADCQEAPVG